MKESTVSKILELVENSSEKKAVSEQFITRFAKYYTPCVVYAALALFLIPTLMLAFLPAPPAFLAGTTWDNWLHRALTFLVISCPCALVISVPLSFFGRHRRRVQVRHSGQGRQLSGGAGQGGHRCVRQDRHPDPGHL